MQMALVLVLGSAMASAKACKKALAAIATLAHDKRSAILVTLALIHIWRIRSLFGGRSHTLQKLKHRGVHVKVDAQQADSHAAMIANYNGGDVYKRQVLW